MCYCIVICFLNNQCFIGSRRNVSPLPYKIRADPHWAFTQDLSFLGHLALFVGVLVASKQVTFKKEEINLAPGWAVMSSACLTWPCRDGGPRAGFKGGQWLDVSFPVNFPEGPEQSTASCMGPSAASLSTPVAFAPCGSSCWGSSPQPPGKSPRLSYCKSPSISC